MQYKLDKDTIFLVSQKAVIKNKNRYLILKSSFDNKWEMPGGLIDDNESMDKALKREIKEEIGLIAKVGQPFLSTVFWHEKKFTLNGKAWNARIVTIAHICTVTSNKIKLSDEHTDYAWVTPAELKKYPFAINSKFIKNHLIKKG